MDSGQDTIHSEGTVSPGHDLISFFFPRTYGRRPDHAAPVHRLPLDQLGPRSLEMLSNRLAFAALAIACIGAAAGGGYLATRQNTGSHAGVRTGSDGRAPPGSRARRRRRSRRSPPRRGTAKAVQETEGGRRRRARGRRDRIEDQRGKRLNRRAAAPRRETRPARASVARQEPAPALTTARAARPQPPPAPGRRRERAGRAARRRARRAGTGAPGRPAGAHVRGARRLGRLGDRAADRESPVE